MILLDKEKWLSKDSFKERWKLRNKEMAAILKEFLPNIKKIAVMGSGPLQNFEKEILLLREDLIIESYDLKKWNNKINQIDLENFDFKNLKNIDCVIYSGVLEYLDISDTLEKTFKNTDYVLMSYAPIDFFNFTLRSLIFKPFNFLKSKFFSRGKSLSEIKTRIKGGWRTFYSNLEFIKELSKYGLIIYFDKCKSYPAQGIYLVKSKIKDK